MTSCAYQVESFEDFWPHYVNMHRRPATQAMHALGSVTCAALLLTAVVSRRVELALVAPLMNFAIAQASHRVFEANQTTPWKNQAWHTRAEARMLRLVVTGRMHDEVLRVAGANRPA